MSRNRYGGLGDDPYLNGNGDSRYGQIAESDDYDPYNTPYSGRQYNSSPRANREPPPSRSGGYSRPPRLAQESSAEKQIGVVLEHIKAEWPAMCENECVPVHVALQLLDTSSVGRAHEYREFERTHRYLQDSLKGIVHEHHQGFNSSIGTFHKIQASIQASQKRVRSLKESLSSSKTSLATSDPELRKLAAASQNYDDLIHTLSEVEELRLVPDNLEARISEKRFLTAVDVLQAALRRIRAPALDDIGALSDLKSYLANQETALTDILVEELHDHLYLKSPYCQERWQALANEQGGVTGERSDKTPIAPFYEVIEFMDLSEPLVEDPSRNPEADTFYYIALVVESLDKLGHLESAVNTIKQRLPVELFSIVAETNREVDQKHPSSLRGVISGSQGNQTFGIRENRVREDVIYDLLWTLYAKFEAIAEGHRVFHDVVKAIVRREGGRNSNILLGGFRELWNLYQNEIRSLLHNYVTTDADVYQFNSSPNPGSSRQSSKREQLFQFSDTDAKSIQMTTEYQDLEGIIRAAVPGLMSGNRKVGAEGKKQLASRPDIGIGRFSRRMTSTTGYDGKGGIGAHKSLVEPSVFNMSLLLPPTLSFLQRLKGIVPPGSDLVTSTLTSFLDNFLVNVFLPQLEETLGKLSESVFGESEAFQQDPEWAKVARRPIFKGTSAFFDLITAFCRMLDTIPHDQALSQLIITQMMRYYDVCCQWFKSLVSKMEFDVTTLKLCASLATGPGEIHDTMQKLWTSEGADRDLLENETGLLILYTNENPLKQDDIIADKDTISSLCILYTSMKWLAIKIDHLRHITRNDIDSSRTTMQKPVNRRWTLLNDPTRAQDEQNPVYLPMTQETVVAFDSIVSSYQDLAGTVLLTLHINIRCQIIHSLLLTLSPSSTSTVSPSPSAVSPALQTTHLLTRPAPDPSPTILALNASLVLYDETITRYLPAREIAFIRAGLGLLIDDYLVVNAGLVRVVNAHGVGRLQLDILVLQQNLKNVEVDGEGSMGIGGEKSGERIGREIGGGVRLKRAARFWGLWTEGPDGVLKWAREGKEGEKESADAGAGAGAGEGEGSKEKQGEQKENFSYEELKTLLELCYSEQVNSPERGISTVAKRGLGEHLLLLSEVMWQS